MATGRSFLVQHLHLGPTGSVLSFSETTLNNGGAGPWLGQLGQVFEQNGKFYRLVQGDVDSDVDYIDGGVAYWHDKSNYIVTADASEGEAGANGIAGGTHKAMDVSVVGADRYFFIQCGGDQAAVVVAASTVASDHMTGHASTDNVLTRTAAGTAPVNLLAGTALTTRGTTTSDSGASVSDSSKVRWHFGALI